ncbi:MAG TPA: PDZ domain-containing protein [Pyrinomonadaceae bacterium]|nr:PDZ domain-containing protein [Pyrinomonadaceae bacterium]
MIHKSLAFLLIGFVLVVGGDAQTSTPGAKGDSRTFSMFFDGDGSYLGVQTEEVTKDNFAKYGLRDVRGVAVEKVVAGSPAEKAGLQSGDVIVRFNNEEITSVRKLTRLLGEVAPDHQARLTVIRGGGEREITATLGKRPTPKFEEGAFAMRTPGFERVPFPSGEMPALPPMRSIPSIPGTPDPLVFQMNSGRRIGIAITSLTKQLSEHFGVENGVLVTEVRADSPAAKAGLKAGDIIVEVEGKEVKSDIDLIRAINDKREGDVTLTFIRDRNRQTISVTPEKPDNGLNGFFEFPSTPGVPMTPQQFKFAMPPTPVPMTEFNFPGRVL